MFYMKKNIPIFQLIGAVILFGSWISQNYMQAKFDEEYAYLILADRKIQEAKINYDIWYIHLIGELHSEKPNERLLLELEYRTAYQLSNFIQPSVARISKKEDNDYAISVIGKVRALLEEGKTNKDKEKIQRALILLTKTYNKMHDELINNADLRTQKVTDKRRFWNNSFVVLYLLGSLFIAFGAVRSWIGWKLSRENVKSG